MTLTPGTRLGPYEIAAQIGAGGMGEVYQATDTNLKRAVAIKVLPESVAGDAERLARFQREAEVLAALNHPNIAAIYGLERAAGTTALVMELVDGQTLADRIAQGAIPVDGALQIARQIADALEAAHEQGIIHRDLKPANVKVRPDGTVKVLDFGLAKAMEPTGVLSTSASMSPTITTPAMTQAGMIMGTAAYMSPEQARGKPVDKRADIWAFGCVLFEMLTGQRAFGGEDVTVTLARVVERELDLTALPATTPARVSRVLSVCLRKDPKQRAGDIRDVRLALEGAFETAVVQAAEPAAAAVPAWRRAARLVGAVALAGLVVGFGAWTLTRPAPPRPVHLTMAHPGPEVVGGNLFDANLVISPDGRYVAYVASASPNTNSNTVSLYVRALDQPEPTLLSTSARTPFFSPDSQWVGFVEDNAWLSKVAVTGGPSVRIGNASNGIRGASWGPDDGILFATSVPDVGLSRIPAAGGDPEVLTTPDVTKGEGDHVYPEVLPGGRAVLFTILNAQGPDSSQIAVLDMETRTSRVVIQGGSHARYSQSGHIVYGVNGTLRAVAFDLDRLEVRGTPVPVLDEVVTKGSGAASFSVSPAGTLAYVRGDAAEELRTLVWVNRMGQEEPLGVEPRRYGDPELSPDGTRVAIAIGDGVEQDVWIWSLSRRTLTRLTFEPGLQANPLWTPDGTRIVYRSGQEGLFWRPADGTGTPEPLLETGSEPRNVFPQSWSTDGRLLFVELRAGRQGIGMMPVEGARTTKVLLANPSFNNSRAAVSPDGRWVAYQSNESGQTEVYVRPFPDVEGGKWQVSTWGTRLTASPRWAANGRTLFIPSAAELMAATIETVPTFAASTPQRVVSWPAGVVNDYDVSRDGTRFLVVKSVGGAENGDPPRLNVVLNWHEELKRLVPAN